MSTVKRRTTGCRMTGRRRGAVFALVIGLMVAAATAAAQPAAPASPAAAQAVAQGQKIVMATHSFNVFIGPNRRVAGDPGPLARLATEATKTGHEMLAVQMIGGSTPMQHWNQGDGDDARNIAKVALSIAARTAVR